MLLWILLLILLFSSVATVPAYPYSRRWGYYPTGGFGVLFLILLVLWFFAMVPGYGHGGYWW